MSLWSELQGDVSAIYDICLLLQILPRGGFSLLADVWRQQWTVINHPAYLPCHSNYISLHFVSTMKVTAAILLLASTVNGFAPSSVRTPVSLEFDCYKQRYLSRPQKILLVQCSLLIFQLAGHLYEICVFEQALHVGYSWCINQSEDWLLHNISQLYNSSNFLQYDFDLIYAVLF